MIEKILCGIYMYFNKGVIKQIDGEKFIIVRRESLEPNIMVKIFGLLKLKMYVPIIIIEGDYDIHFNDQELRFIVYHELAYYKYNHFNDNRRKLEYEIQADIYAINIVGKDTAISALEKIKEEARWTCKNPIIIASRLYECKHYEI